MEQAVRELVGRTVAGRFRLVAFLGEGAMASVYRGQQDGEPRDVAVKIMHPELLRDATFPKRFAREAKAAARIVHRNSVQIVDEGADGDLLFIVMELLNGKDLFDVLERERRLHEARAARIVIQVCGALGAAHAHGIVHRDLKPENVMVMPDPNEPGAELVKVLDFGIAKILERPKPGEDEGPSSNPLEGPPSSALTMVGGVVGTPEYMSPEQATGQPIDTRSDIYACGILLYHLVCGRPPFKSDHLVEILMGHVNQTPPAPSTLLPGIHPGLEQIILKALAKNPDARHQSAGALALELTSILPELGGTASGARAAAGNAVRTAPATMSVRTSEPPPATQRSLPAAGDRSDFDRTLPIRSDPPPPARRAPDVLVTQSNSPLDRTLVIDPQQGAAPKAPEFATNKAAMAKTLPLDGAAYNLGDTADPRTVPLPQKSPDYAKTLPIDAALGTLDDESDLALAKTLAVDSPEAKALSSLPPPLRTSTPSAAPAPAAAPITTRPPAPGAGRQWLWIVAAVVVVALLVLARYVLRMKG